MEHSLKNLDFTAVDFLKHRLLWETLSLSTILVLVFMIFIWELDFMLIGESFPFPWTVVGLLTLIVTTLAFLSN